jgi:triosephosphate isomerase
MNKTLSEAMDYIYEFVPALFRDVDESSISVTIFAPSPFIHAMRSELGDESPMYIGAQDLHFEKDGAWTGETSGTQVRSAGATHVLVGHSERRTKCNEDNSTVGKKLTRALKDRLIPVLCVGEKLMDREAGKTRDVVAEQLGYAWEGLEVTGGAIIAYEPVWAIGTGKQAEPKDAQEMCGFIRNWIKERFTPETASAIRILYGGSITSSISKSYTNLPDVDGVLVGGASLDLNEFLAITRAFAAKVAGGVS